MPSICRGEPSKRHRFEPDGERIEIPGPQGIQATFDWQAAKAVSPVRMCTAVLVNTVVRY